MKMIYVDKATKVNPSKIAWVELTSRGGREVLNVSVEGRVFEVLRPITEFLDELDACNEAYIPDHFAG